MKYDFMSIQSSINYLKTVAWYRRYLFSQNEARMPNSLTELYKSKNFLVVNKPFDLLMYNFNTYKEDNLIDLLRDKYPYRYDPSVKGGFRAIHRLD